MQFRPKTAIGFELNEEVAEKLDLLEEYKEWKSSLRELSFAAGLEEKYAFPNGPDPLIWEFKYERGGEIQSLEGFEWDKTYCWFLGETKVKGWKKFVNNLKKKDVHLQEASWVQLG